MMDKDEYLGDGLYASYDGWQFRLWTERENGVHEVFLDPHALHNFIEFTKREEAEAGPR